MTARVLYEVAHILESVEGSEERMLRVLELLGQLVPYQACALLEARPGRAPRVLVVPAPSPDDRARLVETLTELFGQLVDERAHAPEAPARSSRAHLAVPLIGLDQVIGVLVVRADPSREAGGSYTEDHLCALSIVGANLAAYLMVLRAHADDAAQARALEEARHQAEAANRAKDAFLALVSHELKTPLTSTLAWAHVLGSKDMSLPERARAVGAIERSVGVQAKLIDEILDLACIAAAELRLDLETIEPARLIEAAIEEQRLQAERRSIRLDATLDRSVKQLIVDRGRLGQIVSNLLANAIKFTPSGGHVQVRLERVGIHARIQVIDTGKGISPEVLPHVFERFSQSRDPIARARGGLGVGLAIVKNLVELHGGSVHAESPGEEKGTTFSVELPLPPDVRGSDEGEPRRVLAGIRVLLVDDDDDIRDAFRAVLEHHGAEVTGVASVAAALTELERARPDVLLSDLSIAGESGYDLMRRLAARDPTVPAAALTGHAREEDRRRALSSGFRMHLGRPIEIQELVMAVATLAGRPPTKASRAATAL